MRGLVLVALVLLAGQAQAQVKQFPKGSCSVASAPRITRVGEWWGGNTGGGGVEVMAYSYYRGKAYLAVVESNDGNSGIALLDVTNTTSPTLVKRVAYGGAADPKAGFPNSVSFFANVLAVAADGVPRTGAGVVRLHDGLTGGLLAEVATCAQPDMVTWSKDGSKIYVACEAEPSAQDDEASLSNPNLGANAPGAIGVITPTWKDGAISGARSTKNISIQAYVDRLSLAQYRSLLSRGLIIDARVASDKARAAIDIEPEYMALDSTGTKLYATLQENNAVLVVDLVKEVVTDIWPLGFKDWSRYRLDASDKDDGINLATYKGLRGLFQPDTIQYALIGGKGYIVMANEGDSKEEKMRAGKLSAEQIDASSIPNWDVLKADDKLGRININPSCGLKGGVLSYNASKAINKQGPYAFLCTYGGRSFMILDASSGRVVFESGDDFETIISQQASDCFNCDRDANDADSRSDDSGVEPEALDVAELGGRFYAFVGLERQAGIMVYDITTPAKATFVEYWNNRNRTEGLELPKDRVAMGDLAPEGIKFVPSYKSPSGTPLLLVTNEQSGSVTIHTLTPCAAGAAPYSVVSRRRSHRRQMH